MTDYIEIVEELEEIGEEKAFQRAAEMLAKGWAYAQIYASIYSEEFREVPYNREMVDRMAERIYDDSMRWMVMEHHPASIIFFERGIDENGGTIL